jgi:RNA-binding protein
VPKELTPAERQALKGRAHGLDPVVLIGTDGLTPAVLAEVERALKAHELIKIRIPGAAREGRERVLGELCTATDAVPVQHIGKTLVLYRERPEQASPRPPARPTPPRKPPPRARTASRSGTFKPRRGQFRPR